MLYVQNTGAIFQDKKYGERCWTHNFDKLLALAELDDFLKNDRQTNQALSDNWDNVEEWVETSRYQQKTQREAQELYDAVTAIPNGAMAWIRTHW